MHDPDPSGRHAGALGDRGGFERGQQEVGLAYVEVRSWDGLASARHVIPTGPRRAGGGAETGRRAAEKKSADDSELIRLSSPEIRRLLVRWLWCGCRTPTRS